MPTPICAPPYFVKSKQYFIQRNFEKCADHIIWMDMRELKEEKGGHLRSTYKKQPHKLYFPFNYILRTVGCNK